MESNIFTRLRVAAALEKMIIAKLFTDSGKHPEENLKVMRERYQLAPSLPTYLLVKPNGDLIAAHPGWEPDEEKFLAFLAQAR